MRFWLYKLIRGESAMYELLVVDDEYEIRNGLCNYFPWEEIGYRVAGQAENGKKALDFILSHHVDVILCDIKMPVLSGIELAREIYEKSLNVRIIFLSAYKDFEYAQKALEYKAFNYIVKPTKYNEILTVFSRLKQELDMEKKEKNAGPDKENEEVNLSFHDKIIHTIKAYVTSHYGDATLDSAADLVHLNPFYLSKYFKEKTGENFSDFVLQVKMKKALELLNQVSYKTCDISRLLGYSSPKNFTRTFKRYYGFTPSHYRGKEDASLKNGG